MEVKYRVPSEFEVRWRLADVMIKDAGTANLPVLSLQAPEICNSNSWME